MTSPPPPPDSTPPAAGGGFGPPQDFGPAQGYGPEPGQGPGHGHQQGFGQPQGYGSPQAYGQAPGYAAPQSGYGAYPPPPPPPGSGPSGPKIAALFIAGVLAAGLAVGSLLILQGSDDGDASADAKPRSTPGERGDGREPAGSGGAGDGAAPSPSSPTFSPSVAPTPGDLVPFVVLKPGRCFDHPALDVTVKQIKARSCGAAHDGEVIANKTLTGTFTTEQQLQTKALELCEPAVTERMKAIPEDGRQYFNYALYPSLDTYRIRDEKRISCALTLSDAPSGKKLTAPLPR
ncbi:hypothetical protein ABZW18_24530 [Streptomyces sp. NPDC004647]|uniref:hypothetical protein n=1 Tax=Streptomyces sp. NPDC004647 TaxID=3154671 RepID=UPI0033B87AA9